MPGRDAYGGLRIAGATYNGGQIGQAAGRPRGGAGRRGLGTGTPVAARQLGPGSVCATPGEAMNGSGRDTPETRHRDLEGHWPWSRDHQHEMDELGHELTRQDFGGTGPG